MLPQHPTARPIRLAAVLLLAAAPLRAQANAPSSADPGWPRVFLSGADSITIYQPQVDSWAGDAYARQGEQSYSSTTAISTAAERTGDATAYTGQQVSATKGVAASEAIAS